ncbi:MAG: EAL domain-containing protein [Eubacterium sp.]|nr:EAL domain-containing protein [Eubacterium sp.]
MGVIEEVRDAMARREFVPFFQPQYDVMNNKMWSVEILARWIESDGNVIMPGYFIPELEMSNDILKLDWYMIEEACLFLSKLDNYNIPKIPISINLSGKHVYEVNTCSRLCEIVDSYHIPHKLIILEVAENTFLDNPDVIKVMLDEFKSAGFRIAIDDFGNGSQSMDYLASLNFDVLKIDRTMFNRDVNDVDFQKEMKGIFDYADKKHVSSVAQGIETQDMLNYLKTAGCRIIQGYIYDKPMPESVFIEKFKDHLLDIEVEDILLTEAPQMAADLLVSAVFSKYKSVTYLNLSKNSYYVTQYDDFGSGVRPVVYSLAERLANSVESIHPDDRELYMKTFSIEGQMEAFKRGEELVELTLRQEGGDGIYRLVKISNIFVKSPAVEDVLAISLYDVIRELEPDELPVPEPKPEKIRRDIVAASKGDMVIIDQDDVK